MKKVLFLLMAFSFAFGMTMARDVGTLQPTTAQTVTVAPMQHSDFTPVLFVSYEAPALFETGQLATFPAGKYVATPQDKPPVYCNPDYGSNRLYGEITGVNTNKTDITGYTQTIIPTSRHVFVS